MCYHAAPIRKENHTHAASTRVITDTAVLEILKSTRCSMTHELRHSNPTRTRTPNSNRTRSFLSGPCTLYLHLASVRPWTEGEIEHKADDARVFDGEPRNKPRNVNADYTESCGRGHVLRVCNVPCPKRYDWSFWLA